MTTWPTNFAQFDRRTDSDIRGFAGIYRELTGREIELVAEFQIYTESITAVLFLRRSLTTARKDEADERGDVGGQWLRLTKN